MKWKFDFKHQFHRFQSLSWPYLVNTIWFLGYILTGCSSHLHLGIFILICEWIVYETLLCVIVVRVQCLFSRCSRIRIWFSVWSLSSWSWRDKETCWSSAIRPSCDVCSLTFWTRALVRHMSVCFVFCACGNRRFWGFVFVFFIDDLPYLKCPLHVVLKLTPVAYGLCRFCTSSRNIRKKMSNCRLWRLHTW